MPRPPPATGDALSICPHFRPEKHKTTLQEALTTSQRHKKAKLLHKEIKQFQTTLSENEREKCPEPK